MGKPSNEIIASNGGVAQEEWLRDESEHPYKFVPTKASGNTVPFPAITKCNTFILRHYAAGIVEEIGQRMQKHRSLLITKSGASIHSSSVYSTRRMSTHRMSTACAETSCLVSRMPTA